MKYGIYYAYWEKEWGGEFIPYISKVKTLGFDSLEVACGAFHLENDSFFTELRKVSEAEGIALTGGYGPRPEHNLASTDSAAVKKAFDFYADVFRKMELAGIHLLCGALYSYWPVDFKSGFDKPGDFERSVKGMQTLADMAADHGIELNMEALNRFEGYLINDCDECLNYVKAVDKKNVHVMLDTFHMNIEEDSFVDAIRNAGKYLGHFHVGEGNRRPPYAKGRMPWKEIGDALNEIGYDGTVVMEPFVRPGGQVGKDISIWRDLSHGADDAKLDADAAASVKFLRELWG
ncbi:MAG: sugar phosphate isomerase/epimerase [Clostridiales bacterium]|nr:sugar phosphate isomerase/epimerase [Clostridiales bacterium]